MWKTYTRKLLLLVILLCVLSITANKVEVRTANFALVQSKVSPTASTGVSFTGVGAGHLIVVGVEWYQASGAAPTITGVNDGGTDTFTLSGCATGDGNILNTEIAYTLSAAAGTPTIDATFSATPSGYALFLYEYSYTGTAFFDTCSSAHNPNANATTSSLTTAQNNELIGTQLNTTGFYNTVPSGFGATAPDLRTFPVGATYEGDFTNLVDALTAGSNSINWTLQATQAYSQTNAAFYVTGGGPPTCPKTLSLLGVGCQ